MSGKVDHGEKTGLRESVVTALLTDIRTGSFCYREDGVKMEC